MRFRRGTCGLCKPTKRYKTNATRRSKKVKNEILAELAREVKLSIRLRETNK